MRLATLSVISGAFAGLVLAGSATAEVLDATAGGFTIQEKVEIAAAPQQVWAALGRIGAWWDPQHTYSHDPHNLSIVLETGGCWCETLPGGGRVGHMMVINVQPFRTIRMMGALGPLQAMGVAGALTWTLEGDNGGTRLTWIYDVGGHAPGGLDKLASPVDGVLGEQARRLKAYVETGAP